MHRFKKACTIITSILMVFCGMISTSLAQEDDDKVHTIVDEMPQLKGGLDTLQQQLQYPEEAKENKVEGKVIVRFIVNKKGKVENPEVLRGIGAGCNEEAIRIINKAEFEPGMQDDKPVKVQYSLPITFRL